MEENQKNALIVCLGFGFGMLAMLGAFVITDSTARPVSMAWDMSSPIDLFLMVCLALIAVLCLAYAVIVWVEYLRGLKARLDKRKLEG